MPAMTNLLRSTSGNYFYRRTVPAALRAAVGKREIKIALRTSDPQEAKRRHSDAHRQACELIDRHRATKSNGQSPVVPIASPDLLPELRLSPEQINRIACRWRSQCVSNAQFHFALGPPLTEAQRLARVQQSRDAATMYRKNAIERDYPENVVGLARQCLDDSGTASVPNESEEFPLVCYAITLALADWMEAEAEWRAGNTSYFPSNPVLATPRDGAQMHAVSRRPMDIATSPSARAEKVISPLAPRGSTLFEAVIAKWFSEKSEMSLKTRQECQTIFRRLGEVAGGNPAIGAITDVHVLEFAEALARMPRQLSRSDQQLPMPAIIEKYGELDVQRISTETVRKQIGLLQSFFGWATKHKYVTENFAEGLKPKKTKKGMRRRIPFTIDDLQLIFGSPLYRGCLSARKRAEPGSLILRDECYWLPLLALFTGGRLEELGSLLLSEVKVLDGVMFLELDVLEIDESDKTVSDEEMKSGTSLRAVPVHPLLIACGFGAYVSKLRQQGERRLFPRLRADRHGKLTARFSKWFGRFLAALQIEDPRKVFHSFRHNFKAACRNADLREDIHDRLTGHWNRSVGRTYGEETSMRLLAGAIEKIGYPGLDLSHVRPTDSDPPG